MNDEIVIRDEALAFARRSLLIRATYEPIEIFEKVKNRLNDFYAIETKSIFLDEINKFVVLELKNHRDQKHDGAPDPTCEWEKRAEKLLFYIKQEVGILPIVAHQKNPTLKEKARNKVFVSYSREDVEYLDQIKKYFKPFSKDIDFWDDSAIQPGQKWKAEIKRAIESTKVAILLVSTDFLGSDFIAKDELPPLLEAAEKEGAVILITILRPCLLDQFPELSQFQAMNSPSKPVSKMDVNEREDLYVNIVRQVQRIFSEQ